MTVPFAYPGGGPNTYVPSYEASGLLIQYLKDANKFAINSYVGQKKEEKSVGKYLFIDSAEAARFISSADFEWPDGSAANPDTGYTNTSAFQFLDYSCDRKFTPFTIGYLSQQQAAWQIVANEAAIHGARAMTEKTVRALSVLLTGANWGSNTNTATSLGGGLWSAATSTNFYIRNTIQAAVEQIILSTYGMVQPSDLTLVVNPHVARLMFATDEVANYVKGSPFSEKYLTDSDGTIADRMGMPEYFSGVKLVIENAVKVTTKKGATTSASFAMDGNSALLLCKKDQLVNVGGTSQFNTMTRFYVEDHTVEIKDDPDNRRTVGRIVWNDTYVLTAPASGYLITHLFS